MFPHPLKRLHRRHAAHGICTGKNIADHNVVKHRLSALHRDALEIHARVLGTNAQARTYLLLQAIEVEPPTRHLNDSGIGLDHIHPNVVASGKQRLGI